MHAKSWSDKIFQSKQQDFLRTHIAKIGTNPTGEKEYTTAMFPKVAQTCAKCHAPAAVYSKDFNVTIAAINTIFFIIASYLEWTCIIYHAFQRVKAT